MRSRWGIWFSLLLALGCTKQPGDAAVTAEFVQEECAGLVPPSLGETVSALVPGGGSHRFCVRATSDAQGSVAVGLSGMGPHVVNVYSSDGRQHVSFGQEIDTSAIIGEQIGFQALNGVGRSQELSTWNSRGEMVNHVPISGNASFTFPAATGGSVVVSTDSWDCPHGGSGTSTLQVYRITEAGTLRSVVDIGGQGCPVGSSSSLVALSDHLDNTFVVVATGPGAFGFPALRLIARWLGPDGRALNPWTDVGPEGAAVLHLRPLIGGGAALRDNGKWLASFRSGEVQAEAVPAFLRDHHDVFIVRDGFGYAMAADVNSPGDGTVSLFSVSGTRCGSVELPRGMQLWFGRDGTVIGFGADDRCVVTWWPSLLR